MSFRYRLASQPERYIRLLAPELQRQVIDRIHVICENPRDRAVAEPLAGRNDGLHRARRGNLRILFYVDDDVQVVEVSYIGPRGDAYKGR